MSSRTSDNQRRLLPENPSHGLPPRTEPRFLERRFNTRFFVGTLIVCALVASLFYWIHRRQVVKQVHAFLDQAEIAKENHQIPQAAAWLRDYLQVVPGDLDVREQYARLLVEEGTKQSLTRGLEQMDRVLRGDPDRMGLRREYARRAFQLRRYADMEQQLLVLDRDAPNDSEVEWLFGQCYVGQEQYDNAVRYLTKALTRKDGKVDRVACSALLAHVLRQRLQKTTEADQCINALIKEHPTCEAYLASAHYWEDATQWGKAEQNINLALKLQPNDPKALLAAAQLAMRQGHLDKARQQLQKALQHDPDEPMFYRSLAALEIQAGNLREAAKYRRQLLDPKLRGTANDIWNLADVLVDLGDVSGNQGAAVLIRRLGQTGYPPELVSYLTAKLDCRQGKWAQARQELEPVAPQLTENPQLHIKSQWLLAQCYQQLGNLDLAIAAFRQALDVDPARGDIRRALVASLVSAGRLDEAVDTYRSLAATSPADKLALTQLLLQRNLNLPEPQRRWDELNDLRNQLQKQLPNDGERLLLEADIRLVLDPSPATKVEVRKLLQKARDQHPKQFAFWLPLIRLAERQGDFQQAKQLLTDARIQTGDSVDWRLASASLIVQHANKSTVAGQLKPLETRLEHFSPEDQVRLLEALAGDYAAVHDTAETHRLLRELMSREPNDLLLRARLFDLALHADQLSDAQALVAALQQLEGPDGNLWRLADAALQLVRVQKGDKALLSEVQQKVEELSRRRPNWARVHVLQAQVAELANDPEQAITHYQAAVQLGEREPKVVRRLVTLLYQHRRYKDANTVLDRYPESLLATTGLSRIAVEVALQSDHAKQAANLARQAFSATSKDYHDQLSLGYVFARAGRTADAEAALREAVRLAPKQPETHIALVAFYAETKQLDRARAAIREARSALSAPVAPLILAHCYELVGDPQSALAQYKAALQTKPDDPQALRALASFYLDHKNFTSAQPLLQHLLDPATHAPFADQAWARRWLAMGLAARPGSAALEQALKLLDANVQNGHEDLDNIQARAVVKASRPWYRSEAIRLFEQVQQVRALPTNEGLMLASLYEANQDWDKTHTILRNVLANDRTNIQALTLKTRSLLDEGNLTDATVWQQKLDTQAPGRFETVELDAKIFAARQQVAQAVAAVNNHASQHPQDLQRAAHLLEELNQPEAAERLYREYASRSGPAERLLPLAAFLGRQNHAQEALKLCERAWVGGNPVAVVSTALDILSQADCSEAEFNRVEGWLRQLMGRTGASPLLTMALANLEILRGQHAPAEQLLRQVVGADPNSAEALNNLAWLLAARPETAPEALHLIQRAIRSQGPKADLLDTRAMIHLTLGEPTEAVKDLKEALAQQPSLALSFHLAQAQWAAGQQPSARQTLAKAEASGLTRLKLPRLEREKYDQFRTEVSRASAK